MCEHTLCARVCAFCFLKQGWTQPWHFEILSKNFHPGDFQSSVGTCRVKFSWWGPHCLSVLIFGTFRRMGVPGLVTEGHCNGVLHCLVSFLLPFWEVHRVELFLLRLGLFTGFLVVPLKVQQSWASSRWKRIRQLERPQWSRTHGSQWIRSAD